LLLRPLLSHKKHMYIDVVMLGGQKHD